MSNLVHYVREALVHKFRGPMMHLGGKFKVTLITNQYAFDFLCADYLKLNHADKFTNLNFANDKLFDNVYPVEVYATEEGGAFSEDLHAYNWELTLLVWLIPIEKIVKTKVVNYG